MVDRSILLVVVVQAACPNRFGALNQPAAVSESHPAIIANQQCPLIGHVHDVVDDKFVATVGSTGVAQMNFVAIAIQAGPGRQIW